MTLKFILVSIIGVTLGCTSAIQSHRVNLSICDLNTTCLQCGENITLDLEVNTKAKSILASGLGSGGQIKNYLLENCSVTDESNWSCSGSVASISMVTKVISIETNPKSSLYQSGKEVCLIKK